MKSKQNKKPLVQNIKKTGCPLTFKSTETVDICKCNAIYLVSHSIIPQVSFTHNHPLESAHVASY